MTQRSKSTSNFPEEILYDVNFVNQKVLCDVNRRVLFGQMDLLCFVIWRQHCVQTKTYQQPLMISLESPCFAHRLLEKCFLSYPSVKSRLVSSCFSLTSKVLRYRDARFLPANRVRNCKVIKLRWKRGLIAHAPAICVRKLWQCDCTLCFAVRRIFAQMIRPSILQCSAICVLVQLMLWGKYWRYFLSGTSLFLFRKFDVLYAENLGVVVVVFWRYFTSVFQLVVLFMQSEKLWRFFIELWRQNVFFYLILFFYLLLFHEHKYNTSHNIQGTENEKKVTV